MKQNLIMIFFALSLPPQGVHAQEVLSLESFLNQVSDQNLGIKVEAAKAEASNARAAGIALPPPSVGFIQMTEQGGSKTSGFEVSQTIPFPSKLSNDRLARKFEAQAQDKMQKAYHIEILAKAKLLYFSLWAAQERMNLLKQKKTAIEQHIKLSVASSRSDNFAKIHILKAESDVDMLDNEFLMAEQTLRNKQIEAAEFINADPIQFKPNAQEPSLSLLPPNEILSNSYQLESAKFNLESFRAREDEAKASWFPEFNVRYKQMGESAMYAPYNEIMLGMTLPFAYFWEPRAMSKTASAQRLQAEFEYSKEKRKIETGKASLYSKAQALKKQIDNLNAKLLPRAEKRMRLVHNLAPRDMETLQDHRETMEAFPDLKLKTLEYREQYEDAISELQKYSGHEDAL
ncbi:MAG: TolC family protein [Pseudobdellovibrionaceae bacterium]